MLSTAEYRKPSSHKGFSGSRKPARDPRVSLIRMRSVVQVHVGPQLNQLDLFAPRLDRDTPHRSCGTVSQPNGNRLRLQRLGDNIDPIGSDTLGVIPTLKGPREPLHHFVCLVMGAVEATIDPREHSTPDRIERGSHEEC